MALQLRLKLDFGIDIPDLPSLPLPKLSLPDLKLLLPDLPDLPGIDLPKLELAFPDFDIDVPNVDFPRLEILYTRQYRTAVEWSGAARSDCAERLRGATARSDCLFRLF